MSRHGGIVAAIAFALVGCSAPSIGYPIDPSRAREIEPLRSKRADVEALLGPPVRVERVGGLRLEVHKFVTANVCRLVVVSYRDTDEVVHVTTNE